MDEYERDDKRGAKRILLTAMVLGVLLICWWPGQGLNSQSAPPITDWPTLGVPLLMNLPAGLLKLWLFGLLGFVLLRFHRSQEHWGHPLGLLVIIAVAVEVGHGLFVTGRVRMEAGLSLFWIAGGIFGMLLAAWEQRRPAMPAGGSSGRPARGPAAGGPGLLALAGWLGVAASVQLWPYHFTDSAVVSRGWSLLGFSLWESSAGGSSLPALETCIGRTLLFVPIGALFYALAVGGSTRWSRAVAVASTAAVVGLGVSLEALQGWLPARSSDWASVGLSGLGAALGTWGYYGVSCWWRRWPDDRRFRWRPGRSAADRRLGSGVKREHPPRRQRTRFPQSLPPPSTVSNVIPQDLFRKKA